MIDKKTALIQSALGSVFSVFSEKELKEITGNNKRSIAICGKVNKPGIVEVLTTTASERVIGTNSVLF